MADRVIIFGRRFAALRRDRFLTQEEFAQRLEMSPANVRRLEQCEAGGMQVKNFRRLAELVNVSPADLRQRIGPASGVPSAAPTVSSPMDTEIAGAEFPSGLNEATRRNIVDVPHFHGVSAARTEERTDAHRGRSPVPAGSSRRFAVTVDGDCMEPKYHHGETVVFSIDAAEREGIVDGKNYFVQFADGENTFKRVFLDPENRELLILRGWNERYPARVVERSKVKLLARAIFRLTPDE
jgi:transcriptional regulator with XRE-family HTH domain